MRWDDFREDTDQVLSGLLNRMKPELAEGQDHFIGTDDDFRSPLHDYLWAEDDRLRDFEAAYCASWALAGRRADSARRSSGWHPDRARGRSEL